MNCICNIKKNLNLFKSLYFFLIFLSTFLLYSSFLSCRYGFDSVDYAIIAETGYNLFWGHHFLQHALQKGFYDLWKFFGYTKGAIVPLQILNALCGALGVTLFFLLIKRITQKVGISLIVALSLAFSNAYWFYSREVEILIMPCLLLIVLFMLLLQLKENSSWKMLAFIGLVHGVEGLLYQAHFLFWPTVVIGICFATKTLRARLKNIMYYLLSFLATIVIPYGIAGFVIQKQSLKYFMKTFFGAISNSLFTGFNSQTIILTLQSARRALIGYQKYHSLSIALGIMLIFLLYFLIYFKRICKINSRAIVLSATFIFSYLPCQMWYVPENYQYWIPSLIPFWLILALIYEDIFSKSKNIIKFVPFFVLGLIFLINFFGVILPSSNPKNNNALQRSYFIKDNTKEGDLIIFIGAEKTTLDSMYIPYFAKREPFSFYRFYTWHDHITVKYYDTDILKALENRINYKLTHGNSAYIYEEVFNVKKPYPTLYNFKWPIENNKLTDFLKTQYKISYYVSFKNEIIYKIENKS